MLFSSEKLREAQGRAQDLGETIAPHVDQAVETARTVAREQVMPRIVDAVEQARDQVVPRLVDAAEQTRDQAREHVVPRLLEARDQALEQAAPVAKEARRRGREATLALKGEQPVKRHRVRNLAIVALLAGAGVAVAKALQGKSGGVHSAPSTPAPRPAAAPDPVEVPDSVDEVVVETDESTENGAKSSRAGASKLNAD